MPTQQKRRASAHTLSYDTRTAAKQAAYGTAAAFETRPSAPKRRRRESPRRYIPALDGLRAIAVCAVIAYHLGLHQAQGGLQGVTIFFVLSGYLITGLLLKERDETGGIALGAFWLRRIRRLFPATLVVVAATAAACTLINHELLTKMRPDIPPALFWFTNWWYIFHDISYFEAIGSPSPLQHFWSLAIEEQFYVVWPLLILAFSHFTKSRVTLRRACLVLAVVSAGAMALLFDPAADPSRVYYGTDTRAFSLLLGAWLACLQPGKLLARNYEQEGLRAGALDAAGAVALLGILASMVLVDGSAPGLYYGGMFAISALAALVIAALVQPDGTFVGVMAAKPLVWLGQRSYGMYLWHYPVILLMAPYLERPATFPWWACMLAFACTIALAALSYHFVENPIRRGALGALWQRWRSSTVRGRASHAAGNQNNKPKLDPALLQPALSRPAAACASAIVALLVGVGAWGVASVPETTLVPEEAVQSTGVAAAEGISVEAFLQSVPQAGTNANASPIETTPQSFEAGSESTSEDAPEATTATSEQISAAKAGGITHAAELVRDITTQEDDQPSILHKHEDGVANPLLIGDSVPGALYDWQQDFPYGLLDSYIGRWPWQSQDVYADYLAKGLVGHVIVLPTFSNHLVPAEEIDELVESISPDHAVYLVNVVSRDSWVPQANEEIAACAEAHEHVQVIDWVSACAGHESEYLYDDGLHLTPAGAAAYQAAIKAAIITELAPEDVVLP